MHPLTSIKHAELRIHELRVDAARARLAADARRGRRLRSRVNRRGQPDVARRRALGRIVVELARPLPAHHLPDRSDAA
ncbi:MAG: hypothetical protein ACRD2C_14510 [Acidimicrobiales bacterium]